MSPDGGETVYLQNKDGTRGKLVSKSQYAKDAETVQDEEEMITALFDLEIDPGEARPIKDDEVERYMRDWMVQVMEANSAPNELFVRMGLGAFRAG